MPSRLRSALVLSPAGLLQTSALTLLGCLTLSSLAPAFSQTPPAPASQTARTNRPVLRVGSQGESVTELQAMLKLLGYYREAVNGNYQQSTADAVSAFQQAIGLAADGIVGSETWNRLLPPSPAVSPTASASSTPTPASSSTPAPSSATAPGSFPSPTPSPVPPSNPFPSPTPSPVPPSNPFPSPSPSPAPAPSPAPTRPTTPPTVPPATPPANAEPSAGSSAETNSSPASVDLPTLRLGMRGSAIEQLQERLQTLGFYDGEVDGIFGEQTLAAVEAAQRNFGLEPDGVVGPATWGALLR